MTREPELKRSVAPLVLAEPIVMLAHTPFATLTVNVVLPEIVIVSAAAGWPPGPLPVAMALQFVFAETVIATASTSPDVSTRAQAISSDRIRSSENVLVLARSAATL